jgi:hypothetical protein
MVFKDRGGNVVKELRVSSFPSTLTRVSAHSVEFTSEDLANLVGLCDKNLRVMLAVIYARLED